jgi:hypothetical protein
VASVPERLFTDDLLDRAIGEAGVGGRARFGARGRIEAANGGDGALHVHGTVEVRAFHDPDARRGNIATYFGGRRDEHRDNAAQVTFNGTFNDNTTGVSIADDDAVDPDRDTLRVVNRAFDTALEDDVLVGRELTLENKGLPEYGNLP